MRAAEFQAKLREQKGLYGDWLFRYQHVERLGDDEVDGLLEGTVVVQEKIDGANATVAWDEDAGLIICTRNRAISIGGEPPTGFRGLVEYVLAHEGIKGLFRDRPDWILRGEWLVRHSIVYPAEYMNKLYVFDVQLRDGSYIPWQEYKDVLSAFGIEMVPHIAIMENPTVADLVPLTQEPSAFGGGEREGIVAKRYDFVNCYGRAVWGKLVSADFGEKNKLHFGTGNKDPKEVRFASTYVTEHLVLKVIDKIRDEHGSASVRNMPEILGRVWYDVFNEELWNFVKKEKVGKFDFRAARKLVERKTRDIALAYFNGVLE